MIGVILIIFMILDDDDYHWTNLDEYGCLDHENVGVPEKVVCPRLPGVAVATNERHPAVEENVKIYFIFKVQQHNFYWYLAHLQRNQIYNKRQSKLS